MSNVSVAIGRTATLECTVSYPKSVDKERTKVIQNPTFCNLVVKFKILLFQVAWIKVLTTNILTMDERVVTRNNRISVANRQGNLWQLTIEDVKPSDQGWYMCQINTDPMVFERGYLEITSQ